MNHQKNKVDYISHSMETLIEHYLKNIPVVWRLCI